MSYTRKEVEEEVKKALPEIERLYAEDFVKRIGSTKDTKELYTEVLSEYLLRNLNSFDDIGSISRTKTYCEDRHAEVKINLDSGAKKDTGRKEENFAKRITYLKFDNLGTIKDYQIPLKDTRLNKGVGKIDLISFNDKTNTLYLIELKYEGNKESLLRATLESYTYFKIVDHSKIIDDFKSFGSSNPSGINVVPAVLVTPGCQAYNELLGSDKIKGIEERPQLKALSLTLGIKYFTLEMFADEYVL